MLTTVCLVKKFTVVPNVALCIRTRCNCLVLGPLCNSATREINNSITDQLTRRPASLLCNLTSVFMSLLRRYGASIKSFDFRKPKLTLSPQPPHTQSPSTAEADAAVLLDELWSRANGLKRLLPATHYSMGAFWTEALHDYIVSQGTIWCSSGTLSFTHSLNHSLTRSVTHSLSQPLTQPFIMTRHKLFRHQLTVILQIKNSLLVQNL